MKKLKNLQYIWKYFKDEETSKLTKVLMVLGVAYIVSPLDFIPEIAFPLGIVDDGVVLLAFLKLVGDKLDSYVADKRNKLTEKHDFEKEDW